MPFKFLPTLKKQPRDTLVSISYRRNNTKNGRSKNPTLIVGVPMASGFKPKGNQTFGFFVGSGADAGKAAIRPHADGVTASGFKNGFVLRFGFVPALGYDAADKEFVKFQATTDSLSIALPAWFKVEQP
jgi:hypothetical protein